MEEECAGWERTNRDGGSHRHDCIVEGFHERESGSQTSGSEVVHVDYEEIQE